MLRQLIVTFFHLHILFAQNKRSLLNVLQTSGFSYFESLINKSGMTEDYMNSGPYTVLMPNENAFLDLEPAFMEDVSSDSDRLRALILGHMIPGKVFSKGLRDGFTVTTLLGDDLVFSKTPQEISVNRSSLVVYDIDAWNGVIHVINKVLADDSNYGQTLTSPHVAANLVDLLNSKDFDTFRNYLKKAKLLDILSYDGPYTVFVPPNEAFHAEGQNFIGRLDKDEKFLRSVLLQHISFGKVTFPESGVRLTKSISDSILQLSATSTGYFVNDTIVRKNDVIANNGVLHIISNVLLHTKEDKIVYPTGESVPEVDLVSVLRKRGLAAFASLLNHTKIDKALSLQGPITIFAPSDEAFRSLSPSFVTKIKTDQLLLKHLLLHHIVKGHLYSSKLAGGWRGTALDGQTLISSTKISGDISVSGATVAISDFRKATFLIHVVSEVILPSIRRTAAALVNDTEFKPTADLSTADEKPQTIHNLLCISRAGWHPRMTENSAEESVGSHLDSEEMEDGERVYPARCRLVASPTDAEERPYYVVNNGILYRVD